MNNFKPTYLYIKQHNVTKLKYFGKTTNRDPVSYKGSGLYWKEHLKIHGNDVTTLWHQLFEDQQSLIDYSINFSRENQITESINWANLKDENGLDGFNIGHTYNKGSKRPNLREYNLRPEVIERRRKNNKGNTHAKNLKGHKQTDEHKRKRSESMIGKNTAMQSAEHIQKRFIRKVCKYCGKEASPTNYTRWHNDNCKLKI